MTATLNNQPNDSAALKLLLSQLQQKLNRLQEGNSPLRQRLFGRKTE